MWRPPEYAYADEWADACRVMPPGSPFPGPWSTDRTPHLRAPMRAFADPGVDVVVLMVASQMGKTEAGFNVLGWVWDSMPAPSMWVTPTEKLAHTLSKDRLHSMFKSASGLWDRVDKRFARPGSLERWIAGVRFGLAWAGSATELASHPCKFVIVDERSRMGEDTGGEGDPVRVVQARTKMYAGSKVGVFSSPGEEGICPTYDWWTTGTKLRWCWRCPGCGEWLFPSLEHARYPEGADFDAIRSESWVECPTCQQQIRDDDRAGLEADYIPTVIDDEGRLLLAPEIETRNSVASYWATGFASLVTGIGYIMEHYARAERLGKPGDLQAVVNTQAGELWKLPGEGASRDLVKERQVESVPDDLQLVTAGVDVGENSLYYVVRGWRWGGTSWLLAHDQIHGATEFDDVWLRLARVLEDTFCGRSVGMVLVDSGYHTEMVYRQTRARANWAPSKGLDRNPRPYFDTNVDESVTGRALKTLKLWNFSNDTWKTWLYSHIKWDENEPGAWFVPRGIDDVYCSQVTNERVRISRGKREWYRTGNRENHYLDCEVLATVAAHIQGLRQLREPVAPVPEPVRRQQRSSLDRRGL